MKKWYTELGVASVKGNYWVILARKLARLSIPLRQLEVVPMLHQSDSVYKISLLDENAFVTCYCLTTLFTERANLFFGYGLSTIFFTWAAGD